MPNGGRPVYIARPPVVTRPLAHPAAPSAGPIIIARPVVGARSIPRTPIAPLAPIIAMPVAGAPSIPHAPIAPAPSPATGGGGGPAGGCDMAGAGDCTLPGAPMGPPPPIGGAPMPDTGGPQPDDAAMVQANGGGWPWWVWLLIIGGALYLLSDSSGRSGGEE